MIRKATPEEFLKCLQHESVAPRLHVPVDKVRSKNNYVVEIDRDKLYFVYFKMKNKTAEMHVAAIKDHRGNVKRLIKLALGFMRRKGFKRIITWAPEIFPSTINMAKNLGFQELRRVHNSAYGCDAVYLGRIL